MKEIEIIGDYVKLSEDDIYERKENIMLIRFDNKKMKVTFYNRDYNELCSYECNSIAEYEKYVDMVKVKLMGKKKSR